MKIVQVLDHSEVARIAGDGREPYPRRVLADTEAGDSVQIRGSMKAIWVRWRENLLARHIMIGRLGPDRHGAQTGLFVED